MAISGGNVQMDVSVLDGLIKHTPGGINRFREAVANAMRDQVADSVTGPSPSEPGNPPGLVTGALHDSITVEQTGPEQFTLTSLVGYAGFLELGTEKMAARPFFVPVFEEWYTGKMLDFAREADLLRE